LALSKFVSSSAFDMSLSALIFLNVLLVILEVNNTARGNTSPTWLSACNFIVLFLYFLELCARLYVLRGTFFRDRLRALDFTVITLDIIITIIVNSVTVRSAMPVMVLVRVARVMKVTRAMRMMTIFPELHFMLTGMWYAMKTILWGVALLAMLICFWAIFAVLFIQPVVEDLEREGYWAQLPCDRCPQTFVSVEMAMLTLVQQFIMGEGWDDLATPMMEKRPETAPFFILVLVSTTLAALNLFMGAVLERAMEARAVTLRQEAQRKDANFQDASRRLYTICQELDTDRSGFLTFSELKAGFDRHSEFADLLKVMDIEERDLEVVFNMLDADGSGSIEYEEFVEQLHMMKDHEAHTLLVFIKFYVMELRNMMMHSMPVSRKHCKAPSFLGLDELRQQSCSVQVSAGEAAQASSSATERAWPELEAELGKLVEIRREVLDFSRTQVDRLDDIQRGLFRARSDALPHPTHRPISQAQVAAHPGDDHPATDSKSLLTCGLSEHRLRLKPATPRGHDLGHDLGEGSEEEFGCI